MADTLTAIVEYLAGAPEIPLDSTVLERLAGIAATSGFVTSNLEFIQRAQDRPVSTLIQFAGFLETAGGDGAQDMKVAWTPSSFAMDEALGFFTYGDLIDGAGNVFSGELIFSQAHSTAGFDIESTTQLTAISFPNLVDIDPSNTQYGDLTITANTALVSVSLPLLQLAQGGVFISGNTLLDNLVLPAFLTASGGFNCSNNPALTTVNFPLFLPTDGSNIQAHGCALSVASVNHILARCVAASGYVSGNVDLSGQTPAAPPSGQGVTDMTTLITDRSVSVATD